MLFQEELTSSSSVLSEPQRRNLMPPGRTADVHGSGQRARVRKRSNPTFSDLAEHINVCLPWGYESERLTLILGPCFHKGSLVSASGNITIQIIHFISSSKAELNRSSPSHKMKSQKMVLLRTQLHFDIIYEKKSLFKHSVKMN